ncbi:DALR anticodon-binding domain-containing protein [Streptomyces thermocarboxydus]|uniref:ArgS-related anticodon-binding protein NrtL n=1 Tax=Streptomyces TaxID=1883 RepID=UPI0025CA6C87|nr:DALR anticodon-binding domain-containing protein [Streptomyces thermocarboxydus]
MTPVELSRTVLHAVRRAVDEGELAVAVVPERVVVAPPGPGGCGDYATNVALQLARPAGQPAPAVAEVLRTRLLHADGISDVVVTGPGFLNISLAGGSDARLVRDILRARPRYGHSDTLAGQTIELHAAPEVRALVLMDSVARVLRSQGARPELHCTRAPEDAWVRILGVPEDIHVRPGRDPLRPVPAPADPTPLGRDAARWALLHPAQHDRPHLGGGQDDQHLAQRETNPLFRVRYAHARTRALLRNAADLGFTPDPGPVGTDVDALLHTLADHPRVLAATAAHRAPDRLARHLVAVADALAPLLPSVLPLGDEKPSAAHRARLALAEAAGTVLAGGLTLLGIDAPEHL